MSARLAPRWLLVATIAAIVAGTAIALWLYGVVATP